MPERRMVDCALEWAGRGFAVFPLREGSKEPALKGNWKDLATRDADRIRSLWGKHEYNVGVATDGLIVADLDDKNGKTGSADWELLSFPDETLTVQTPSGGRHIYYRDDTAVGQAALTKSIDVRAGGLGYVLAPGSVVDGKEYTILKDLPLIPAPAELAKHCQQRRRKADRQAVGELDTDEALAMATAYLEGRKGSPEGNRDNWTYVTACEVIDRGVSSEMCFDLLLEWNDAKNDPPLEEEAIRRIADSAWRNRLTPAGSQSIEAEFDGVVVPEVPPKPKPKFLWLGDKTLDLSQQWLMFNRFPRIGTAALVGPSNSGKTFLALDLGACLGSGEPWLGVKCDEEVGTVILTAEGIGGLPARMAGYDQPGPVVATTVKLMKDNYKEVTDTLEEANRLLRAKGVRLGVVVIDTLTASGLLENENDNSEIGRALNYLEQMAVAFQCLVLVTHHPPKTGHGLRGGYALHAGFDVVAEIFQEGNERFVECTKSRDAPTGSWGSFVLEPVTVLPDFTGKGRDVTTQRVIYGTLARQKRGKDKQPPDSRIELFLGAFEDLRAELKLEAKVSPVPLAKLESRYKELVRNRRGSPEQSWRELLRWAKDNEMVTIEENPSGPLITETVY
jgi:hypothetical protein